MVSTVRAIFVLLGLKKQAISPCKASISSIQGLLFCDALVGDLIESLLIGECC